MIIEDPPRRMPRMRTLARSAIALIVLYAVLAAGLIMQTIIADRHARARERAEQKDRQRAVESVLAENRRLLDAIRREFRIFKNANEALHRTLIFEVQRDPVTEIIERLIVVSPSPEPSPEPSKRKGKPVR